MVFMMKGRIKLTIIVVLALMVLAHGVQVNAHTPASIDLSYDISSQILSVDVSHSVSDVNSHYIYEVVIEKNSVEVLTKDYTSQNTTSGFLATYSIPAVEGDVLSVTAKCIQSGQISDEITVGDTTPTNGDGTPMFSTPLIAISVVALLAVIVIVILLRRR